MISFSLLLLLPIMSSWSHVYHYRLLKPEAYQKNEFYNTPSFTHRQAPGQVSYNHISYPYSHAPTKVVFQPNIHKYNSAQNQYRPKISPKIRYISKTSSPSYIKTMDISQTKTQAETFQPNIYKYSPQQNQYRPKISPKINYNSKTSFLSDFKTTDIVSQTKTQANNLINILKTFGKDQRVKDFVAENFSNSTCVTSIEEAISATKAVSDMVTEVNPELVAVIKTYNQIKYEKYPPIVLRGTATLLKQLDVLVPKLETFTLSAHCSASPEDNIKGLENLSKVISELATTQTINFDNQVRGILQQSANIVDVAIDAVASIRNIFQEFDSFCSNDDVYNAKAVDAIGELFDKVAKLLKALGSEIDITAVKEKNLKVARGLMANLAEIRDLDLGFVECNTARSYKGTAEELSDVADIIDDIGIKNLEQQLGIKFNLQF